MIPKPLQLKLNNGEFILSENTTISFDEKLADAAEFLLDMVEKAIGVRLKRVDESGDICFALANGLSDEEYKITCSSGSCVIKAAGFAGAFYAVQTVRQLAKFDLVQNASSVKVPACDVSDKPRFAWRGILFDEARHFFGKTVVKKLLSTMALHKLNVLHWHLTDDQGWRVEIKKYPLLTEIGSKRDDTCINGWHRAEREGKPHSGFYTQDDIREIVAFAKKLNITVVPEIDMPAHFAAAFAAYPHLACREIETKVPWHFGGKTAKLIGEPDWNRSACVGKETTFEFIFNVIDEIAGLFPAKYFHIGGDEAPLDEWKKCPHCQARMKDNNIPNVDELQGYFNNRINEYVKAKGKNLITWNEALKATGLDATVVSQYWTPQRDGNAIKQIKNGRKTIISKHQSFYFDMPFAQYTAKAPYMFVPSKVFPKGYEDNILGLEGTLWTEWIDTPEKLEFQLHPRMAALAESAWCISEKKDFKEFKARLVEHRKILDACGVNYAVDEIAFQTHGIKSLLQQWRWYNKEQGFEMRRNDEIRKR